MEVISGKANMEINGLTTTIKNSPSAVINWQQFNINKNELVQFIQENQHSAVFNKVTSDQLSQLNGTLKSNGQVFLINPNGIIFGKDSVVDTAGFVASTLNLSNEELKKGKLAFEQAKEKAMADIVNNGLITVAKNGTVALVGGNVTNNGKIKVENGNIFLLAGQKITLSDLSNPAITYSLSAPKNKVLNLGEVFAKNGKIKLSGGNVVNKGTLNADSTTPNKTGKIELSAKTGTVSAGGKISADGVYKGGVIKITGDNVVIENNAEIHLKGKQGGGTAYIGGDEKGEGKLQLAKTTHVKKTATIDASATENGKGGKVIVWGNKAQIDGTLKAKGGEKAGDGGFIETSGKTINFGKDVNIDATAKKGKGGEWLLDPENLEVVSDNWYSYLMNNPNSQHEGHSYISRKQIETALNSGSAMTLSANKYLKFGEIDQNIELSSGARSRLTLIADTLSYGGIVVENGILDLYMDINRSNGGTDINHEGSGTLNVNLNQKLSDSPSSYRFESTTIYTKKGDISLTGNFGDIDLRTRNGKVNVDTNSYLQDVTVLAKETNIKANSINNINIDSDKVNLDVKSIETTYSSSNINASELNINNFNLIHDLPIIGASMYIRAETKDKNALSNLNYKRDRLNIFSDSDLYIDVRAKQDDAIKKLNIKTNGDLTGSFNYADALGSDREINIIANSVNKDNKNQIAFYTLSPHSWDRIDNPPLKHITILANEDIKLNTIQNYGNTFIKTKGDLYIGEATFVTGQKEPNEEHTFKLSAKNMFIPSLDTRKTSLSYDVNESSMKDIYNIYLQASEKINTVDYSDYIYTKGIINIFGDKTIFTDDKNKPKYRKMTFYGENGVYLTQEDELAPFYYNVSPSKIEFLNDEYNKFINEKLPSPNKSATIISSSSNYYHIHSMNKLCFNNICDDGTKLRNNSFGEPPKFEIPTYPGMTPPKEPEIIPPVVEPPKEEPKKVEPPKDEKPKETEEEKELKRELERIEKEIALEKERNLALKEERDKISKKNTESSNYLSEIRNTNENMLFELQDNIIDAARNIPKVGEAGVALGQIIGGYAVDDKKLIRNGYVDAAVGATVGFAKKRIGYLKHDEAYYKDLSKKLDKNENLRSINNKLSEGAQYLTSKIDEKLENSKYLKKHADKVMKKVQNTIDLKTENKLRLAHSSVLKSSIDGLGGAAKNLYKDQQPKPKPKEKKGIFDRIADTVKEKLDVVEKKVRNAVDGITYMIDGDPVEDQVRKYTNQLAEKAKKLNDQYIESGKKLRALEEQRNNLLQRLNKDK